MYTTYYDYELLSFVPVLGQDTGNGFVVMGGGAEHMMLTGTVVAL